MKEQPPGASQLQGAFYSLTTAPVSSPLWRERPESKNALL